MDKKDAAGCECWACKARAEGASDAEVKAAGNAQLKAGIEQSGIVIMTAGGEAPGVATLCFTAGFTDIGMPEVIIIGLPINVAVGAINIYHAQLLEGVKKPGPCRIEDYFNCPVQVIEADEELAILYADRTADYYEGQPVKWVQWVLSDRMGKFEWEVGYDHAGMPSIPMLGPPPVVESTVTGGDLLHFAPGKHTLH